MKAAGADGESGSYLVSGHSEESSKSGFLRPLRLGAVSVNFAPLVYLV